MNWKFWQKKDSIVKAKKLPKPKELPQNVGRYMVVKMGLDPDYVWHLKSVSRPKENSRTTFDIRIFDEDKTQNANITIKDFNSLDERPHFILFEGWYDTVTLEVGIEHKTQTPTAA